MQPIIFKLPDLGEGVVEAEIIAWHVQPGQEVLVDQPLVDVMTDKATVTIPSGLVGRVLSTHGKVGEMVAVGAELVSFDTATPQVKDGERGRQGDGATNQQQACSLTAHLPLSHSPPLRVAATELRQHVPTQASPAVRRRARELSVDLEDVHGSGPNGRITHADLDVQLRSEFGPMTPRRRSGSREDRLPRARGSHTTEIQMVGLRRRIAEKMVVSNSQIPHFTYIEEVDITELESLREHLNESRTATRHPAGHRPQGGPDAGCPQPKLTYLPFIMLAVSRALCRFPQLNAHYDVKREVITRFEAVHLGVATQTDRGLCVPVVRHTEAMDLWQAAHEMRRITEAGRSHSISRDELSGSTFTVTSLGRMGGLAATPIINHPEVGILGVNKAMDRPVVHHGQVTIRRILHLSGSFDHRVVDGADGATFIQCVKDYLEHPATIFI